MHKLIATLGIVLGCFSAAAEPPHQSELNARCPVGYWLLEPVCINQDSGDVVNATPANIRPAAFEPGCAPGYWRLGELCLSPITGDVEMADEKMWPAKRGASLRN
jgi:hypothetical protein